VGGWLGIDIFAKAAEKAGPDLNNDTLVKSLETNVYPRGFLGNQEIAWSPTRRVGPGKARVAQIQNGKWIGVTDFVE
jgi:branched-chain amino acid transport system substrate-binding protein